MQVKIKETKTKKGSYTWKQVLAIPGMYREEGDNDDDQNIIVVPKISNRPAKNDEVFALNGYNQNGEFITVGTAYIPYWKNARLVPFYGEVTIINKKE